MSLANFLARIDKNIPKIHLRVLHTPSEKKRIGGFYFYLNKIQNFLKSKKIFLYVLTEKNFNLFLEKKGDDSGLYLTNIPWVFFKELHQEIKLLLDIWEMLEYLGFQLIT